MNRTTLRSAALGLAAASLPLLADEARPPLTMTNLGLDANFGDGGVVAAVAAGSERLDIASQVRIDESGRAVVAGLTLVAGDIREGTERYAPTVVRLLADGSLDPAFAGDGIVSLPVVGSVRGLALDSQGRIVVCGVFEDLSGGGRYGVARLRSDGALDTSFSGDGLLEIDASVADVAHVRADLRNDAVVVFVRTLQPSLQGLERFTASGARDTGFGPGGFVELAFAASDLAVRSDGGIVASGDPSTTLVLADGTQSAVFGAGGGLLLGPHHGRVGGRVEIDAQQRIVLFGAEEDVPGQRFHRFLADGTLDATFDGNGVAEVPNGVPGDGRPEGFSMAIASGATARYVVASTLSFLDEDLSQVVSRGRFVAAYDPARPRNVATYVGRVAGDVVITGETLNDVAVTVDGTAAVAVGSRSEFMVGPPLTTPLILRVDLAHETPVPLPDLRPRWIAPVAVKPHRPHRGAHGPPATKPPLRVSNLGEGRSENARVVFYLSRDKKIGDDDVLLGSAATGPLDPGASVTLTVPGIGTVLTRRQAAGKRVIAVVNPGAIAPETITADDTAASRRIRGR